MQENKQLISYRCKQQPAFFNPGRSIARNYTQQNLFKMKNEPVVTYNHMQEDSSAISGTFGPTEETNSHPISLYMLFAVDLLLICGIGILAFQLIF